MEFPLGSRQAHARIKGGGGGPGPYTIQNGGHIQTIFGPLANARPFGVHYNAFTENDGIIHSARADDHPHCALEQPQCMCHGWI